MKTHLKKGLFHGEPKLLTVTLTGDERLDYSVAEWLAAGSNDVLLPFKYTEDKDTRLNYDLFGLDYLDSFVQAKLSLGQYLVLLRSVTDVVKLCISQDIPTSSVWFGPHEAFVTPDGNPEYALIPAKKVSDEHGSPLELLRWLGSGENVHLVVAEGMQHVAAVGDWARRQQMFTPEAFERFIADEFPFEDVAGGKGTDARHGQAVGQTHQQADAAETASAVLDPLALMGIAREAPASPLERVSGDAIQEEVPTGTGTDHHQTSTTATLAGMPQGANEREMAPAYAKSSVQTESATGEDVSPAGLRPSSPERMDRIPDARPARIVRERDGLSAALQSGTQVLGRSRTCDISFPDDSNVSRRHCAVTVDGSGVTIEDLGSSNGTYVDGRRLRLGERVHVGDGVRFRLADEWFHCEWR
jgi:hypothetical protein